MSNREESKTDPEAAGPDERTDDEKYLDYGRDLRAAVDRSIRPWLSALLQERSAKPLPAAVVAGIEEVSVAAIANITVLIEADVEQPLSGPLGQIRRAVVELGPILDEAGFALPARDPHDVQMSPDDTHSLGPASFFELGEEVQVAGITWGAAKAHLHKLRRQRS